ncbi:MAG TPA: hypothetical protein VEV45_07665 [Streptosporangiaceae bacterium]|nr:hypothetical protein [Streptosporangiaceae bacterium]
MSNVPESDEVLATMWRLAQARRLVRFCEEHGLGEPGYDEGVAEILDRVNNMPDLSEILDENGKVKPDLVDIQYVEERTR